MQDVRILSCKIHRIKQPAVVSSNDLTAKRKAQQLCTGATIPFGLVIAIEKLYRRIMELEEQLERQNPQNRMNVLEEEMV